MSTDIVVRIPPDLIEFENLDVLASALALFTGERVEACEVMEIRTASPRAAAAVKALLNGHRDSHPVGVGVPEAEPSTGRAEAQPVSAETADSIAARWERADQLTSRGDAPADAKEAAAAVANQIQPPVRATRKDKGKSHKYSKYASDGGSRSSGPRGEIKAYQVWLNGQMIEQITRSEKDRRLAAGSFPTGAELRHPRAGRLQVKVGDTADHISQVLIPVNGHGAG